MMDYAESTRRLISVAYDFSSLSLCMMCTTLALWLWIVSSKATRRKQEGRTVPSVRGSLPFFGHALYLGLNMPKFMNECCKRYGAIFRIKLFRKSIVVVCSQDLSLKCFNEPNSSISLDTAMELLHFDWALFSKEQKLSLASGIIRKAVGVPQDSYIPKIEHEVEVSMRELFRKCKADDGSHTCNIRDSVEKFVARPSFLCFNSMELDDEAYVGVRRLNHFIGTLLPVSLVLPEFLKPMWRWMFTQLRKPIGAKFEVQVQKYREGPLKLGIESSLITTALKYAEENSQDMPNSEIAELLAMLLYGTMPNPTACMTNVVTFLSLPENSRILEQLREECEECGGDTKKILQAPLLNACLFESVRLSSHFISDMFSPLKNQPLYLGEYLIDYSVDAVLLSGHMWMTGEHSVQYRNSTKFDPFRFLGEQPDSYSAHDIITWGAGRHRCPGKRFAITQMKLFLAFLVTNFDFQINGDLPSFGYTKFSSFGEREVCISLGVRNYK